MSKRPLTFATGSRACGKSTMMELLFRLVHNSRIMCMIDTSNIIRRHIERNTEMGREFRTHLQEMNSGKVIQNHALIFRMIMEEAEALWRECNTQQILVCGTPRHTEQSLKIKSSGHPVRVFHIVQDRTSMHAGIERRQRNTGSIRHDEAQHAVELAWKEYHEMIVPALNPFNGHVLELKREEPMRTRLEKAIDHMVLPDNVKRRMLNRLNTRDHPVSMEVDELDGVKRQ